MDTILSALLFDSAGGQAVMWFEELDQFEGIEAIRSILNSLRRGGDTFWIFYSYNPPKSAWSWVNEECLERMRKSSMRRLSCDWLAGLREIVIDPERCPLTLAEFTLKEYLRDKDGRWMDEIPDGNDHSIDAVRYAVMEDVLRG